MSALERLGRWFEPPVIERAAYRCLDCGTELGADDASCTDCGGEIREVSEPVEYAYWGPYH